MMEIIAQQIVLSNQFCFNIQWQQALLDVLGNPYYHFNMIKSFKCKDIEKLFNETGVKILEIFREKRK